MPFVQRDASGAIVAVCREPQAGFHEEPAQGNPELEAYIASLGPGSELARTDLEFVRVLEDVLDLLMDRNILMFTELPAEAQHKILARQKLRRRSDSLDLLEGDHPV